MVQRQSFTNRSRRPRPALIVAIVLLHLAGIYALARVFAPSATASVERTVVSAFTVTITAPEDEKQPEPDEGASGDAGKKATPKPVTAPKVPTPRKSPAPQASSTGAANTSGARDEGDGTGAAGDGLGTGSGNQGGGMGGGIASKPSVRSGGVEPRDYPMPDGGRQVRYGQYVLVHFTVTKDGRARNCSVAKSTADSEATAITCPLVVNKVRFNPARNAAGDPVEARYGYRVDFRSR